jgi:hypothetical protein
MVSKRLNNSLKKTPPETDTDGVEVFLFIPDNGMGNSETGHEKRIPAIHCIDGENRESMFEAENDYFVDQALTVLASEELGLQPGVRVKNPNLK